MTTPDADRALLDTNVLLCATDERRPEHQRALAVLNTWPAAGVALYTSGQILREYFAVATRPVTLNGLGLPMPAALANVRALRARLTMLAEDVKVTDLLVELLGTIACSGTQVHDANVVATMLVHGVDAVVTRNAGDFERFTDHVRVLDLP